jgi:hypothetical protein
VAESANTLAGAWMNFASVGIWLTLEKRAALVQAVCADTMPYVVKRHTAWLNTPTATPHFFRPGNAIGGLALAVFPSAVRPVHACAWRREAEKSVLAMHNLTVRRGQTQRCLNDMYKRFCISVRFNFLFFRQSI